MKDMFWRASEDDDLLINFDVLETNRTVSLTFSDNLYAGILDRRKLDIALIGAKTAVNAKS